MKERRFESVSVICPYYKHETGGSIACTGLFEGGSVKVTFGNPAVRVRYRKAYCENDGCDLCLVHRMLDDALPQIKRGDAAEAGRCQP